MVLQTSKEQFLVNKLNKQRFISALGVALETTSTVVYSKADANLYIVLAAIDCAKTKATALVGEDTDLLILLAHHACPDTHDIVFFRTKRERIQNLEYETTRICSWRATSSSSISSCLHSLRHNVKTLRHWKSSSTEETEELPTDANSCACVSLGSQYGDCSVTGEKDLS